MERNHLKLSIWISKLMTNKKLLIVSIGIIISILIIHSYFRSNKFKEPDKQQNDSSSTSIQSESIEHVDINLNPIKKDKHSNSYVNKISPNWKGKLEESLKKQMGSELKELKVQPLKALILERDGHALHVHAVIIKIKNTSNMESTFNAMIDSQTGKVLETWNQPVFEPDFHQHQN